MTAAPMIDRTREAHRRGNAAMFEECRGPRLSPPCTATEGRTATRAALLAHVPLFAPLGETERRALGEACRPRTFKAGEVLFHEGDPGHALYLLRAGQVKIVLVAPDGRETILHVCGPGECLGELCLIDDQPRSATAVALDPVEALALYREDLLPLVEQCPRMAMALMTRLAEMVRRLDHQVQDGLSLDLTGRLARKLLDLAEQHGEPTPQGIRIAVRLSQREIAEMVGGARARVNKCLTGFEERGILTVEREQITIRKPDELRRRIY